MEKLICFSASSFGKAYANFMRAVAKPSRINEQHQKEWDFIGSELYSVWAMKYSKKNNLLWNKINIGDMALFYGDRKFIGYGRIKFTVQNERIAKEYFHDPIYSLIIGLEPVVLVESNREKMWQLFRYAAGARVQGMMIPNLQKQQRILSNYETIFDFLKYILDLDEMPDHEAL
ncbi:hypothetical protein [Paenibacillus montanisoli]|uniref:EVE domain-containing protein n=1 Tax=Paenibacillus montanisoli TaxID=2081970 RepID=A0A328TSC2_9BACL|nr:hypothetical protein [Paenibacillus montanisoli]RAP73378.1 hypothetical protein DL346_27095 [Paenibacillus montanisoli]